MKDSLLWEGLEKWVRMEVNLLVNITQGHIYIDHKNNWYYPIWQEYQQREAVFFSKGLCASVVAESCLLSLKMNEYTHSMT